MRRKTYLKAKKVQTFVDVLRMTAYEFTDNIASHFISRGLTSRSQS